MMHQCLGEGERGGWPAHGVGRKDGDLMRQAGNICKLSGIFSRQPTQRGCNLHQSRFGMSARRPVMSVGVLGCDDDTHRQNLTAKLFLGVITSPKPHVTHSMP